MTGVNAASGAVQASNVESDASCRLRSTAVDLVTATRSRRPSVKAPVARSLELLTDSMNYEVRFCACVIKGLITTAIKLAIKPTI